MKTLLEHLRLRFPKAGHQTLKRMVAAGRVSIDGVRATRLSQPVSADAALRVREQIAPRPASSAANVAPLKIIFEDKDILVVEKPAGLLTSTVPREKRATALAIVRDYVAATSPKARVGLIHRLDREAAGLLIFSKTDLAYQSLKTQFFKHTVEREYEAVVHGSPQPKSGRIESRLIERADGSVHSTPEHAKGQRAITDYEVVDKQKGRAVVRVRLLTGRNHQIRAHLSERGCPIVGDRVYGRDGDSEELRLRAVKLAIDHPRTGRRMTFRAAK